MADIQEYLGLARLFEIQFGIEPADFDPFSGELDAAGGRQGQRKTPPE
jgi:hypothetical protein